MDILLLRKSIVVNDTISLNTSGNFTKLLFHIIRYFNLQKLGLGRILFENSGNIGKNYRRHDEVGTPVCITVDFESLDNQTVTVRDRDSMKQERISLDKVSEHLKKII